MNVAEEIFVELKPMMPGDVVLFRGKSGLSGLIRRYSTTPSDETRTIFNHVGVSVGDRDLVEALRRVKRNSLLGRIAENRDTIAVFRHAPMSENARERIRSWALAQVNKKYGGAKILLHLGDYLLSRIRGRDTFWCRRAARIGKYPICSWLVAWAYDYGGYNFGGPKEVVQPDDIADWILLRNAEHWRLVWCDDDLLEYPSIRRMGVWNG